MCFAFSILLESDRDVRSQRNRRMEKGGHILIFKELTQQRGLALLTLFSAFIADHMAQMAVAGRRAEHVHTVPDSAWQEYSKGADRFFKPVARL